MPCHVQFLYLTLVTQSAFSLAKSQNNFQNILVMGWEHLDIVFLLLVLCVGGCHIYKVSACTKKGCKIKIEFSSCLMPCFEDISIMALNMKYINNFNSAKSSCKRSIFQLYASKSLKYITQLANCLLVYIDLFSNDLNMFSLPLKDSKNWPHVYNFSEFQ